MDPLDANTNPPPAGAAPAEAGANPLPASGSAPQSPPGSGTGAAGGPPPVQKRGPGRPRKLHVPAPGKLAQERRAASARENLAKANEARAEKAAAPRPPALSDETLSAGAELFVRFLWMLSGLGARLFGGRLRALEAGELSEGAKEALPLIQRFPFMASLLRVLGLPLWFGRTLASAFSRAPKTTTAAAPALRSVPPQTGTAP